MYKIDYPETMHGLDVERFLSQHSRLAPKLSNASTRATSADSSDPGNFPG